MSFILWSRSRFASPWHAASSGQPASTGQEPPASYPSVVSASFPSVTQRLSCPPWPASSSAFHDGDLQAVVLVKKDALRRTIVAGQKQFAVRLGTERSYMIVRVKTIARFQEQPNEQHSGYRAPAQGRKSHVDKLARDQYTHPQKTRIWEVVRST